ncbi:MAG: hypothetical protein CMQ20_02605 [Gammaproteobacteria bacterium]|nr:hypothetical protein [Gammaproteobacteria bacterium]
MALKHKDSIVKELHPLKNEYQDWSPWSAEIADRGLLCGSTDDAPASLAATALSESPYTRLVDDAAGVSV